MIRCIAIDDEPLALDQIARYIRRVPSLSLIGAYLSTAQAREALRSTPVDLIFLDIEMPDCNGIDFVNSLGDKPPFVIFTTAYPQYAVEGFRVDAVDYILKPLSMDDLVKSVERVHRRMGLALPSSAPEAADHHYLVKVRGTVKRIPVADIMYVKGLGEYVRLCVKGEQGLITVHDSIKHLEAELPDDMFMRVHKSFLVNLKHIESADRTHAVVGGEVIPVGEKFRKDFTTYIKVHVNHLS